MIDKTDQLSRRRYILVALLAITYLLGEIASLSFMSAFTGLNETALEWIENGTFAIFVIVLIVGGWMYIMAQKSDAATFKALNDELSVHHAHMAAIFTFKFVFALSLVLFGITKAMTVNAEDVARIVFTSCLVVSYLRFAYLELKHA